MGSTIKIADMKGLCALAITALVLSLGPVVGQQKQPPKTLSVTAWVTWYIDIDNNPKDGFISPAEVVAHCTRFLTQPVAQNLAAALFKGAKRRRRSPQLEAGIGAEIGAGGIGIGAGVDFDLNDVGVGGWLGAGCDADGDKRISRKEIINGCGVVQFINIFLHYYLRAGYIF